MQTSAVWSPGSNISALASMVLCLPRRAPRAGHVQTQPGILLRGSAARFLHIVEQPGDLALFRRVEERRLLGYQVRLERPHDGLVERRPPERGVRLDDLVERPGVGFAQRDGLARPQVRPHDFRDEDPPARPFRREALADDVTERVGDAEAQLRLLGEFEETQYAVDRLAGVDGVKRAQDQVARLRGGQGDLHGLAIAHLADQDDLRRLAQRGAEAVRVFVEVLAQLALAEGGLLVLVDELDGVFQRHDVDRLVLVDLVEDGRERGRLAAAGRARKEDKPVLLAADLLEDVRQPEGGERRYLRLQLSHDDREIAALFEDVDAETGALAEGVAAIARAEHVQMAQQGAVVADDGYRDLLGLVRREPLDVGVNAGRLEDAEVLDLERTPGGEDEIGDVREGLEHRVEDGVQVALLHGESVLEIVRRRLEERAELLLVRGLFISLLGRDAGGAQVFHDGVVQRLVPLLLAHLHHAGNLVRLRLADEVRNRVVANENLQRGAAPRLVHALEKILRHDALERFRERGANLVLLVRRENVDDAVDGLRRVGRVERSENKMARRRGGERQLDGLQVAHFADENDIRVFTKRAAQRRGERLGVDANLAMIDETLLAAMNKLDRVFHRDDVILAMEIRVIDHRRERRRLAGTRRPRHQNHAFFEHGESLDDRRQAKLIAREDFARDEAEYRRDAVLLVQEIRAVTGQTGVFITEIDVAGFFELLDLDFRGDFVNESLEVVVFERRRVDSDEFAVDAKHRGVPGREMQVGSVLLAHELQKGVDPGHEDRLEKLNQCHFDRNVRGAVVEL